MPTAAIHHWCWCGSLCASWCSRCEDQWYCSPEHLAADWPRHRAECVPKSSWSSSSASTPSPSMQPCVAPMALQAPPSRVIQTTKATSHGMVFPVDSERPKLIQVNLLGMVHEGGVVDWQPVLAPILGADAEIASMIVSTGVGGEALRFPLQVFFRSNFLTDGSRSNRAVESLTHGKSRHDWRGPIVALKYSGTRLSSYTNITMSDLPSLVYFLTYLNGKH